MSAGLCAITVRVVVISDKISAMASSAGSSRFAVPSFNRRSCGCRYKARARAGQKAIVLRDCAKSGAGIIANVAEILDFHRRALCRERDSAS